MGWNNPQMPWRELERTLSGRPAPQRPGDGNDSPAWSRVREPFVPPPITPPADLVPYAELHAHSNYSFLDGASHPEELAVEAARLGLETVALTDHDGLYGVVRFSEAAKEVGVRTVFGAELSLGLPAPQNGAADPAGRHLLVLARGADGYQRLSRAISDGQYAGGEKGRPTYDLDRLAATAAGHWLVLTGCRKGAVPAALTGHGAAAARAELDRLVARSARTTSRSSSPAPATPPTTSGATPSPPSRPTPGCRSSPPATSTTPHRRGRRLAPRSPPSARDGASTRWPAGCPRARPRTCGRAPRWRCGSSAIRGRSSGRPARTGVRVRPRPRRTRAAAVPGPARATPMRAGCASWCGWAPPSGTAHARASGSPVRTRGSTRSST